MANKNKTNYGAGPWPMKRSLIEDFILVTPDNRKQAVIIGRILYIIAPSGSNYTFRGTMSIDPCFTKGWILFPCKPWETPNTGHRRVYIPAGFDYEEWKDTNKRLIDGYIESKELYIRQTDPILTYLKE
jgi:hypothetical protein